ncbi:hypothetical protein WR25_21375 [Diploscapter pachys]|uniref:Uncharacterized protein n=1 Tax=Diploscapter pachys TaxID=2018661 RepID=A0A2A2M326_9BILA|nr:hypothetical protein WR25_21375 [Diploscapter pachys]
MGNGDNEWSEEGVIYEVQGRTMREGLRGGKGRKGAHFSKEKRCGPLELSINDGDIFQVTDTLFGGTVGLWQASRVYSANANKGEPLKGVIPNQSTAETIAREQRRVNEQKGKGTLLRRKLDAARRTKSLPKNMLADPAELCASIPLPAYERVALTTPSFHRYVFLRKGLNLIHMLSIPL